MKIVFHATGLPSVNEMLIFLGSWNKNSFRHSYNKHVFPHRKLYNKKMIQFYICKKKQNEGKPSSNSASYKYINWGKKN